MPKANACETAMEDIGNYCFCGAWLEVVCREHDVDRGAGRSVNADLRFQLVG
jgi:hypothetical protein